ncbi:MAG TPA: ComEC/Rec2 family competence protein [Lacibacter sp.]|nr:ComEC/Rec2 family competence protein [Lacibacter sp.]HMO88106.1 ComEC/Rec2 family competence protein [Lacibacter sp.]HMP86955.1 ComEC/Rec2 family competence protein [Lacibacter sp.]
MILPWKTAPFLRLLLPLAAGILVAWYVSLPAGSGCWPILAGTCLSLVSRYVPAYRNYSLRWLGGAGLQLLPFGVGVLLVALQLPQHDPRWLGHRLQADDVVELHLLEPPQERPNTFKVVAEAVALYGTERSVRVSGKLLLYFPKDRFPRHLSYGSVLYTRTAPQPITNAGNPGGFDYQRYALFQGITHQLFLQEGLYHIAPHRSGNAFRAGLFRARSFVLATLQRYIPDPDAAAIAEALLAGYRDDLDRDLVQAYSNGGVVHIIAISGMHLGLIYVLLLFLLRPLRHWRFRMVLVVALLWIFSLYTGASASVLRAVILFSFLAGGEWLQRRGTVYNSLAASAFLLLCWNPFLLWDVGFQLSYAAVLSIVTFQQPICNLLLVRNPLLDKIWQLNAVTLSAQILTLPLCMYHFHQSPNLFLPANLVAVPLGTLSLYGSLTLLPASLLPPLATTLGGLLSQLLQILNTCILWIDRFVFSVTDGISHHPLQTIALFAVIAAASRWLLHKDAGAVKWMLGSLLVFGVMDVQQAFRQHQQQRLIVYNLPRHQAVDLMLGRRCYFRGDTALLADGFLRNFHLKPSRIRFGVYNQPLQFVPAARPDWQLQGRQVVLADRHFRPEELQATGVPAVVVLSHNSRIRLSELAQRLRVETVVIDGSNSQRAAERWKRECDSLRLPCHNTREAGAFVLDLGR